MTKYVALFPGQGSQSVGMLSELYAQYDVIDKTFEKASVVLGFDLWEMVQNGDDATLNQTVNTQPAMLVADIAIYWAFREQLPDAMPAFAAGHSLGEYASLVAANKLDFVTAVKLARKRAEAMQAAVPKGVGAMAAIVGLDVETINNVCKDVSTTDCGVWAANDNAPGQIVIAGHKQAVEKACDQLKNAGAKRALLLPVSVPSHTPLMQPAAELMRAEFNNVTWQAGYFPVLHNADVQDHENNTDLVATLTAQLIQPVRWVETIQKLYSDGFNTFIEFGPGKILTGLNKRIVKDATTLPIVDVDSMDTVIKFFQHN